MRHDRGVDGDGSFIMIATYSALIYTKVIGYRRYKE